MARQEINIGAAENDPNADYVSLVPAQPNALTKVNAMLSELCTLYSVTYLPINQGGSLNDPAADPLRTAFTKINTMMADLFAATGDPGLQVINTGASVNDASAETIRSAFNKVNLMTFELYGVVPVYGPTPAITCPVGAVPIPVNSTTASRQALINANLPGTAFCLAAGLHTANGSNVPKTGQSFTGQYGAIIDGTGWVTSDDAAAAFRAFGGMNVSNVTIRNLVIRNMPRKGIYAVGVGQQNWTVDYCEIHDCHWGVITAAGSIWRHNYWHNNGLFAISGNNGGNYNLYVANTDVPGSVAYIEDNQISYGGDQQEATNAPTVYWRRNWLHHNVENGITETEGTGLGVIEDNIIEDNGGAGIFMEIHLGEVIRNNTIRRNGDAGLLIVNSSNINAYNNTFEDNFRGVTLTVNFDDLPIDWGWVHDLFDNTIHDNTIRVPSTIGAYASLFSYIGTPTPTHPLAPYVANTKNNNFVNNDYVAPSTSGSWFLWWDQFKDFPGWQAIPQDVGGSITT